MKKLLQLIPMLAFPVMLFAQNKDIPKAGRDIQTPETSNQEINIYPNPANGILTITFKKSPLDDCMLVLDKTGVPVYRQVHLNKNVILVNLSYLDTGVYTLVIVSRNGLPSIAKKLVLVK